MVLEKGTRDPMTGVLVRLLKRKQTTFTDEKGNFTFEDLDPGPLEIEIRDETHYTLLDLQTIGKSEEIKLVYYLEANLKEDENSVTTTQRRAKKEVAKRVLLMDEIRKIPGTQGDALKVVQNLPGVARIPFGGGGLVSPSPLLEGGRLGSIFGVLRVGSLSFHFVFILEAREEKGKK